MTAPGISTDHIDPLYDDAFAEGALAGKVSGTGGDGFVVFLVHPEDRLVLLCELNTAGDSAGPVKFAEQGCEP
jgi:D-glycero-alpha-D-manno-heptose-7-phosphate kinase